MNTQETNNKLSEMQIVISAYDMLFFGTGRPFTMEDESWTNGIFPPNPSTFYGYLRSAYFENNMDDFKNVETHKDITKKFEILNIAILLYKNNEYVTTLYPIPFGHVFNDEKKIEPLQLEKLNFASSNPFDYALIANSDGKKETIDNTIYISEATLEKYLKGDRIEDYYKITKYLTTEERIGISKDLRLGKTQEGKLYRISFNHLSTVDFKEQEEYELKFGLNVKANLPEKKQMRNIGGESKQAFLETNTFNTIQQPDKINKKAILYFSTPAIFEKTAVEKYATIQFIANDTPLYIGGWDIKKRMPKAMKNAYPAGTVFFIEFKDEEQKNAFIKKYNNKIGELTEQGFGQFILGNQSNKNQ